MGDQNSVNLSLMKGHAAKGTINNDQPISIVLAVESAKDVSPRKLSLPAKVGGNNAIVESSPLRIFWCRRIVERMGVTQKHAFDSVLYAGGDLDRKLSKARRMLAEKMLAPALDWQSA